MSKLTLHNLDGSNGSVLDLPIKVDVWRTDWQKMIANGGLVMLQHDGLYWLVPIEITRESILILEHRDRSEGNHNALPPVTITLQQCIPIPSETAKILLEL